MATCLPNRISWMESVFQTCVYTYPELISFFLGYISILFWLFAQFPQVIKNYRRQSAESLSLWFLFSWLAGDVSNLIGCILTEQLPFQTYLATYFVFIDTSLFVQCIYYNHLQKGYTSLLNEETVPIYSNGPSVSTYSSASASPSLNKKAKPASNRISIITLSVLCLARVSSAALLSTENSLPSSTSSSPVSAETLPPTYAFFIGQISAWICTSLYLSSRLPQIFRNYKRRTTEGLSLFMFFNAVMGNLSYTLSIFLSSTDPNVWLKSLPFILGSGGTLVFDGIIFAQWWYFDRMGKGRCRGGFQRVSTGNGSKISDFGFDNENDHVDPSQKFKQSSSSQPRSRSGSNALLVHHSQLVVNSSE
ncbi:PQ loop repeat-domain-containing protein [Paraphysoderma sedebokerense]|nr:PQ loop repeat-domain-containing protein [Paraphysoderma sedebokerense]